MQGLTLRQQIYARNTIKKRGMTVTGWARVNNHNQHSVRSALYRDAGRQKNLTPVIEKIISDLISQGFVK